MFSCCPFQGFLLDHDGGMASHRLTLDSKTKYFAISRHYAPSVLECAWTQSYGSDGESLIARGQS